MNKTGSQIIIERIIIAAYTDISVYLPNIKRNQCECLKPKTNIMIENTE